MVATRANAGFDGPRRAVRLIPVTSVERYGAPLVPRLSSFFDRRPEQRFPPFRPTPKAFEIRGKNPVNHTAGRLLDGRTNLRLNRRITS
jgi:hypothetical protein